MTTATSLDTKEQILNVAERLIAERGYAGTTLRNIVSQAKVNLAAVHYHFGSKEELFRAVIARIARPIVERELALLAELKAQDQPPSVEAILQVFFTQPLEFIFQDEQSRMVRAQFMGRCRTEPEPIQNIANQEFEASTQVFLDMLQRALPEQSRSQLAWKFDILVAVLVRVLSEAGKPGALMQGGTTADVHETVSKLLKFVTPGMEHP